MSSSASAKTELETVVNWPLVLSVSTVAFGGLAVLLVLACLAAFRGDAVQEPVAARTPTPVQKPAPDLPVANLPHPVVAAEPAKNTQPRQVYVPGALPPIPPDPSPVREAKATPPQPPAADKPVLHVPQAKRPLLKRLDVRNESALLDDLCRQVKDVDLYCVKGTREKLLAEAKKDKEGKRPAILALRDERPDLQGLPFREGADCQANPKAVKVMQEISTPLRRKLDQSAGHPRAERLQELLRSSERWFREEDGVSTLGQIVQVEEVGPRGQLIQQLGAGEGKKASELLARLALFDFSWPIRAEAIKALQGRPREEYRQVLLEGLRYPWPPVAAHAAEALAAVEDRPAVYRLVDLLDLPDPCAPVRDKHDKWVMPEIVRVNHLRNCLLCHAPSTNEDDPLRGAVPTPGQRLPRLYYTKSEGIFVRADVTYLRQDFSLMEWVDKPDKWPNAQRFDYLVRRHELSADELAAYQKKPPKPDWALYPQREAVLFALRELTGTSAGSTSATWRERLGLPPEPVGP
jgi:hypothetical protein